MPAFLLNIKAWLYLGAAAAILAMIAAAVIEHKELEAQAIKTADAAGYARAGAEDAKAMTAHRAQDAIDAATLKQKTDEVISAYEKTIADSAVGLADARGEFAQLRVCVSPAGGAGNNSPVPSVPVTASGPHATTGEGSVLPSLTVVGEELSRCDVQSDRLDSLQQWILTHQPVTSAK
jgi:hypothetical protein